MGLEQVKNEILDEAEKQAVEIKENAEKQADEVLEEAREEAQKIEEEIEKEAEKQREELEKKTVSKARMDSKKKVQETKQKEMQKIFEKFGEELEDLSKSEKKQLVKNAEETAAFEVTTIRASEDFEPLIDDRYEEIENQGLVLENSDGSKSLNITYDRVVSEYKKRYRGKVSQTLFGEVEE